MLKPLWADSTCLSPSGPGLGLAGLRRVQEFSERGFWIARDDVCYTENTTGAFGAGFPRPPPASGGAYNIGHHPSRHGRRFGFPHQGRPGAAAFLQPSSRRSRPLTARGSNIGNPWIIRRICLQSIRRRQRHRSRMARMPRPVETVPILLRYEGPDVNDGTMSLEDIVPVLQGFASAYGKLAAQQGISLNHRIRITGVQKGSADILLEVWDALGKMAEPLTSLSVLGTTAIAIVGAIIGVVRLKKHVKNKPFKEKIASNNSIEVQNSENVVINMPIAVYEIYKTQLIDSDLAKIAKPLQKGHIDAAEIVADVGSQNPVRERIEAEDRQYLDSEITTVTTTRETWIDGQLNSLTKSTNSGYLYLTDGSRVFYEYVGDNPQHLHAVFGTYSGPVRVYGMAHMDENLKPVRLEITDVQKAQGELFPHDRAIRLRAEEDED